MELASVITNPGFPDMDFKFELDTKSKKSASKGRRRSGLPFNFSLSPREDTTADSLESQFSKTPSSPPKSKRSGGWAGETLRSAMRRSSSAFYEQEQLDNRMINDDNDIPVIPNLDDYDDDEIVKAPLVGHKIATYKELELDLLKHSAFSSLEDVNLRVLTTFIQNQQGLDEPDVPWTRESLLSEIFSQNLDK